MTMTVTDYFNTEALSNKIAANPELLMNALELSYKISSGRITMCCPIHSGDNPSAISINLYSSPVITWKCYTRNCHEDGRNVFNFVSQVLEITYMAAVEYCRELYEESPIIHRAMPNIRHKIITIPRLYTPSSYFINRGFSPFILSKFGVGFCGVRGHEMYMRHVTPIWDMNSKCIGLSGRTINKKCEKCGFYHHGECGNSYPKWKCSTGMSPNDIFYNIHNHKLLTDKVYIVEGQPNLWRLYEAGIYSSLALLGGYMTEGRVNALKKLNVKKVVLIMDGDNGGASHEKTILNNYENMFDFVCYRPEQGDLADLSIREVKKICKNL